MIAKKANSARRSTIYPVVSMITGTTPNGGGVWRHILRENNGLLRQNIPVLVQALHFLDFGVSPKSLLQWRTRPLRHHYNGNFGLDYQAEIFTDSGGFTLMFNPELDLSSFQVASERLPEGIIDLQNDMGATRLTALDYPIPPGLDSSEVRRRLRLTFDSAIRSARHVATLHNPRQRLMIPIHGSSPTVLKNFVEKLMKALDDEGLTDVVAGFGLGSMVPRRKTDGGAVVMKFVRAARQIMPQEVPLHIFGITGGLIPHLVAANVDSMDTSGYVQKAITLNYVDPLTLRSLPWKHMSAYPCTCQYCKNRDILEDQATLRIKGLTGGRKSAVYAAIALHNLEMEYRTLRESQIAKDENTIDAYVKAFEAKYPDLNRTKKKKAVVALGVRQHRREDFDLRNKSDWRPQQTVCLVIPCSQEKPYTASRSYRQIMRFLNQALGNQMEHVDVVFLSGLYGPVPMRYVNEEAITTYDFRLHTRDVASGAHVSKRFAAFLERTDNHYQHVIAYVTQPAYRTVISTAGGEVSLLPEGRMTPNAFYRHENLEVLANALSNAIQQSEVGKIERL